MTGSVRRSGAAALARRVALAALLTLLAVVVAACGQSAAQKAAARERDLRIITPELSDRLAKQAQANKTACQNAIGDFLDAIASIDSRLGVGMNFSDYSEKVGDATAAHDKLDASSLSGKCLSAATDGEKALNDYIKAYNRWNDCVGNIDCNNDSITPTLQSWWAKATLADDNAKAALSSIAGASFSSLGAHRFPVSSADVDNTIYGTINAEICKNPDPPATVAPCVDLQNTLAGGVQKSEQGKLDKEVHELVKALGLVSST